MLSRAHSMDETLAGLVTHVPPLTADTPTMQAYEAFSADPSLYAIAIVDDADCPIGIINRFKFLETLSRPFGRDLLTHRTVAVVMDRSPLVVDERVPLEQLSDMLVDDASKYIFDGFIVTRDGAYLGIGTGYTLMRRLTERKQEVLFHLAHHDPLTGLPNRQLFADRLQLALARARRNDQMLAVLYLDVDRFKTINDSLGHATGDHLLKAVADRLRANVRAQDTLARLGGDEFAIVLSDLKVAEHSDTVAATLLRALREPHRVDGHDVNASCSIGIAIYPRDGADESALMRAADDAAYHAKRCRNAFEQYSSDMRRTPPDSLVAFSAVRRAIDIGHLDVYYQPQVCAGSRALYGFEALVRWRDPVEGLKPTTELIRAAEDAGLIASVTDFVMRTAMRQMIAWQNAGLCRDARLAVNVSGVQIRDGVLPMLHRHLDETGFPPSLLELEITESTVMRPDASTKAVLRELKRLGVGVAVDDFGTGYSSLSVLHRLPVDAVKIDQSFVHAISNRDGGGDPSAIARAIIVMAHSLRLVVTAEGVETAEQAAVLEAHGCDRLQGYLIGRPLPGAAATAFLAQHHPAIAQRGVVEV